MTANVVKKFLLLCVYGYRGWVSPFLGPRCRFYPTCSEYALSSLQKFSLTQALRKICLRLLKCHPFHPGGVDLP